MLFQKASKRVSRLLPMLLHQLISQDYRLRSVSDIRLILGSSVSFGTSVSSQLNKVHLGIRHVYG